MASDIDMASNALLLLGDSPISSFTEPGAGAQAAANLYQGTKERFLSYHPWSFALKEQVLSRLTQGPDIRTGYKYAYQLPTDMIRLWSVVEWDNYDLVGDKLYSNRTELLARYIYDVPESLIPAHAEKALTYLLAAEFAISVTEDEGKSQIYTQKANQMMAQASTIDSQGRPQIGIISSPFVEARRGGIDGGGFF